MYHRSTVERVPMRWSNIIFPVMPGADGVEA